MVEVVSAFHRRTDSMRVVVVAAVAVVTAEENFLHETQVLAAK